VTTPLADARLEHLIEQIGEMTGDNLDRRLPITSAHDHLDAVAHGVNVLVGELRFASLELQRAKEEAEAASRAKTDFLRNVSHELRTPLSAMLAITQLLMSTDLPPEQRTELCQRIASNGAALLELLDDLLDIQRIEAGKMSLDHVAVSLSKAIRKVTEALRPEAQRKGLRLTFPETEPMPDEAIADERRVRQILTNLIGNAIKFTEAGEIRVTLTRPEDSDHVAVDVTDTGIGLTLMDARRLFEPFEQAGPSISARFGGSGLGLSLSRRLAREQGGDIRLVRTSPGGGSTFRLTLPPARNGQSVRRWENPPTAVPEMPVPMSSLAGTRLLVAEDSTDIRLAMRMLLESMGAEVVEASDGLTAVDLCVNSRFDAVLMDIRMPGLDGLSAARWLRDRRNTTPIVALTADAVVEHRAECLEAGFDAYLAKPVDIYRLVTILRHIRRAE
jgi:signal transduction histidine kinase